MSGNAVTRPWAVRFTGAPGQGDHAKVDNREDEPGNVVFIERGDGATVELWVRTEIDPAARTCLYEWAATGTPAECSAELAELVKMSREPKG